LIFSSFEISAEEKINVQIENHIKEAIEKGILQKGDKLPSTREISKVLNVSRNSVIIAYENLENLGIIKSLRGKGTFVATEANTIDGDLTISWSDMVNDYGNSCRYNKDRVTLEKRYDFI